MNEGEVEAGWRVMTYRTTPRCVRIPSAPQFLSPTWTLSIYPNHANLA